MNLIEEVRRFNRLFSHLEPQQRIRVLELAKEHAEGELSGDIKPKRKGASAAGPVESIADAATAPAPAAEAAAQ